MTAVLVGLAGIVVGSVLQALTGWLGDSRVARREHQHWLREKRYEAFLALSVAMRDVLAAFEASNSGKAYEALNRFEHDRFKALMLADEQTRAAIQQELLKFVVTWKGDEAEARQSILRMEMALAPYFTSHKLQRDAGYDPKSVVDNILKWDNAQRAKIDPQPTEAPDDVDRRAK